MIKEYMARMFRQQSPLEMAAAELLEAQRSLLEAESAVEYAQSVVTYNRQRIARLRIHVATGGEGI